MSRPLVIDAYSGPGGVGLALDELDVRHLGIDIQDYSETYPGEFVQADASHVPFMSRFPSPSLLWVSPRCQAYSKLSYANAGRYDWDQTPKERYPTFADLNVRAVIDAVDPDHYIIENVATCDDLREPCRLNGLAFGLPINNERHFETSFPVPDARDRGTAEIPIGKDYVRHELAAAKGIPAEWSESEIRSAIPREFVQYLLHYCPSIPDVPLPDALRQRPLAEFSIQGGGQA
ncbi:hypothetical protein BV210_15070 [Halorientalis sp. IM1011]|uniref:DNA cytosine methyltransferase n=1 Tax=Halorientalis sp. IM1011 TaxID=1932360 RepID=UPI00097CD19F|nr:DNA cytosine methyltransferase [Halorientalis sp. IM1011]AQL43942.1 hypothetical protein BV210_15070 [Halorientalis sp. IM1011]